MKNKFTKIFAAIICAIVFFSCNGKNNGTAGSQKKLSVVATIFPEYDWTRQIVGDTTNIDLTLLMQNGVDLHSFQPSVDDMIKIANCDMFIYVGGESDAWVSDALKNANNKNMRVINLLEVLGDKARIEEIVEGMEVEHDHEHNEHDEHDHEHEHEEHHDHEHEDDDHDHEGEIDEHVWLSLRNAQIFCSYIVEELSAMDSENAATYKSNASKYVAELAELDRKYAAELSAVKNDTLLFCDRFPFRYLVDDYGLRYYAAFNGCSAETEASFETVVFLANKTDELSLSNVITIEGATHKIAETVIANTATKNQNVLVLDSMQSVTSQDIANGTTYISIMQKNLDTLKVALN